MTDIATLAIKVDATGVRAASKDLDNLSQSSKKTEASVAAMTARFAAAAAALTGVAAVIKSSVETATAYQNALNGLASVARYAGEDVGKSMSAALSLTEDGLVSTTEAVTGLKNLLAAGFSTDQAVKMLERLKDAAAYGRQGSLELGQAVVSATEGIKNQNSILVDNAGVTKNISVMQKEYAESIGKTVTSLTEAETRTAIFNGIMRETEAQVGNAALAASGMDGATARLNKTLQDSAVTIGQSFTPAAIALTDAISSGFKGAMDFGVRPFLFLMESIGIGVGELTMKMGALFDYISSPSKWTEGLDPLRKQFAEFERISEEMRTAAAARISGVSVTPVMGADTGKRRQDAVKSDAKKGGRKKTKEQNDAEMELRQAALAAQAIYADLDPVYKATIAWEKYLELVKSGTLDLEAAARHYAKSFGESTDQMTEFARQAGRNIQDAFAQFLFDPFQNGLDGMLKSFINTMRQMAAQAAAAQILQSVGAWGSTGGGKGTTLGNIAAAVFGGGKADGGQVYGGTTYLVGERGPELFTPRTSGTITPNERIGRTVNVINNFTISAPTDRRTQEQIAAMAGASIRSALSRGA